MEAIHEHGTERFVTDPVAARLRARSATEYLLERYQGKITPEQKRTIAAAIEQRFTGSLDMAGLNKILSKSVRLGGPGLHVRTAQHFSEEIETLLSK